MTAIQFCEEYISILEEIDKVIREEYYPAIRRLYVTSPEDLLEPNAFFVNKCHAIGFVWKSLIREHKRLNKKDV